MHLDEINVVQAKKLARTEWRNKPDVEQWLADQGFRFIKHGSYGSVWTDDDRAVVKVFKDDPCYASFVAFCRQRRGNPHLPRISKVYAFSGDSGVVLMEHLTQAADETVLGRLCTDMSRFTHYRRWTREGSKPSSAELDFVLQFACDQPALAATLDAMDRSLQPGLCHLDIRPPNIMLRGETVVIIDPVDPVAPKKR